MTQSDHAAATRRVPLYFAGIAVVLVLFALAGDTAGVYLVGLIGVPIVSGVLAGRGDIRFWHAVAGCVAVVVVDVAFDESRVEDALFFAILAGFMVGVAAIARWVARVVLRRRADQAATRLASSGARET